MQINYGKWDLSAAEWLMMAALALTGGMAVGWLFYDSLRAGSLLAVMAFPVIKKRYVRWRIQRRRQQFLLQFRDLLYSVASSVSVGRSMALALEESISFWQGTYTEKDDIMTELHAMVRQMKESNARDLDVLWDLAARSGLSDVTDFVLVYETCRTSGANLPKAIDRATGIIGDKIALERELRTLMAQKRFEGRIVMISPFLVMLFLKIVSPGYLAPLTASSSGYMVGTFALGLIAIACVLTERVNHIEI